MASKDRSKAVADALAAGQAVAWLYLLPPGLRDWVGDDDLVNFIVAAVGRIDIGAFKVNWRGHGKAQYHPRMMLALLIYCCANRVSFIASDRTGRASRCRRAFYHRRQPPRSRYHRDPPA
jgi:hypothetical protein